MELCGRMMGWVMLVLVEEEFSQGLHHGSCGKLEVHDLLCC